ncbi:Anthranilate phosphoribosyltransferase [Thalassoporum mexicanum PCC 7367]|uniref:anthranilate phosphoribosyltransferase family protein n=1 Tax=Thalassoporum mexicanum TaxID=3457544 RepID=UPI00029FA925|nr:anthranilate phosphoribosyltransferase family protein [Pseudanabaena sp. PCC 7367]AFY70603.1 Anthranilate phosphoribosyltransferase [Pseudanabaena sp. PCC 7367]
MSKEFRELLRKVGSGTHTSKSLSRQEAAQAMRMMLLQEATPAQIGAFMIAHRIRRPTGLELAGMLDAYAELGPQLTPLELVDRDANDDRPVIVLGSPYDGRSRTAPISPCVALILAAAGCAVIMHGGDRMPTKEGLPLVDVWQMLGTNWHDLTLDHVQELLTEVGIGFVYLPKHFPLAQNLVPYREQIGKRPPIATLELIWSPYQGDAHIFTGFVHPPTEKMIRTAMALRGVKRFTTLKGLEGSCDLPCDRTAIIGIGENTFSQLPSDPADEELEQHLEQSFSRLNISPRDYGFTCHDIALTQLNDHPELMLAALADKSAHFQAVIVWNAGFYLWRCGVCPTIEAAIDKTKTMLQQGKIIAKLEQLQGAINSLRVGV